MAPRQRHSGMWVKGQSGNPKGRPKTDYTIRSLARMHTPEAIQKLFEIATSREAPTSAQLRAFEVILNLGWGKVR